MVFVLSLRGWAIVAQTPRHRKLPRGRHKNDDKSETKRTSLDHPLAGCYMKLSCSAEG